MERSPGSVVLVELVRLCVVVFATAGALQGARVVVGDDETAQLLATVLGAGIGYVIGGILGRFAVGQIDVAERRLARVPAGELLAGAMGGLVGLLMALAVSWPVLLLPGKPFTIPLAAMIGVLFTALGVRLGHRRGGDLLRYVGAGGLLPSPTRGGGADLKYVDTSALIDGRLLDLCRGGWIEGTLVLCEFVLYELQGLADSEDEERRMRGRRGLDVLGSLQRSAGIGLEVSSEDAPAVVEVDAKLVAVARQRQAALVTVDGNLARVAEVQGVRVLNIHRLAEDLRPPVVPGDTVEIKVVKAGKEKGQGVGYLPDGTMVVVEGARSRVGQEVTGTVTSILSTSNGRMIFATARGPRLVPSEATEDR